MKPKDGLLIRSSKGTAVGMPSLQTPELPLEGP
jgi:hypothetical protein